MSIKIFNGTGLNQLLTLLKNKFDSLVTGVSGVKGNAENSYRTGNVNLTPANIGAVNKAGDTMNGRLTFNESGSTGYIEMDGEDEWMNICTDENLWIYSSGDVLDIVNPDNSVELHSKLVIVPKDYNGNAAFVVGSDSQVSPYAGDDANRVNYIKGNYLSSGNGSYNGAVFYGSGQAQYASYASRYGYASNKSSVFGGGCVAYQGTMSHAEGNNTVAYGGRSHAEGNATWAGGHASHAEGKKTSVGEKSIAAHAEGHDTYIGRRSPGSHAEGLNTLIADNCAASHVEGYCCCVAASYSHAEGKDCSVQSTASYSHVEGLMCSAYDDYTHAEGRQTIARGEGSHVEGVKTEIGQNPTLNGGPVIAGHAEGTETYVGAFAAHAGGYKTRAEGMGSFAHGYLDSSAHQPYGWITETKRIIANGKGSFACGVLHKGSCFKAGGHGSVALGYADYDPGGDWGTEPGGGIWAYGKGSLAGGYTEGVYNPDGSPLTISAGGAGSLAWGYNEVEARNRGSVAFGQGTITNKDNQVAVGKYNVVDSTSLLIVGNGTRSKRSNALKLDTDGILELGIGLKAPILNPSNTGQKLYFGQDGNGKWGYKTTASGTITPFRNPTGTATAAQVLSGYTFSNASGDGLTGTYVPPSGGTITFDGSTFTAKSIAKNSYYDITIPAGKSLLVWQSTNNYLTRSIISGTATLLFNNTATVVECAYRNDSSTNTATIRFTNTSTTSAYYVRYQTFHC